MRKNRLHRVEALVFNRPLLLTPGHAEIIGDVVLGQSTSPDMDQRLRAYEIEDDDNDATEPDPYVVEDGIAVVGLRGELVNRGSWLNAWSGLVSYDALRSALQQAIDDPAVRGILLDVDSPGGEAAGAIETGDFVASLIYQKPIFACVNGLGASAAYAVISGCSEIICMPSAMVGSIGVVMMHMDRSAAIAKQGLKPTLIHAGAYKVDRTSMQALPDEARDRLQAEVDAFYTLFTESVATHREMSVEAVRATEAGLFMGQAAVDAGLADAVGTLEDAMQSLQASITRRGRTPLTQGWTMTPEEIQAAIAQAVSEATAKATVDAKAAVDAERARTSAILGAAEAKGRSAMAQHLAFNTDMSAEQAIALLKVSPAEATPAAANPAAPNRLTVPVPNIQPDDTTSQPSAALAWSDVAKQLNAEQAAHNTNFRVPA